LQGIRDLGREAVSRQGHGAEAGIVARTAFVSPNNNRPTHVLGSRPAQFKAAYRERSFVHYLGRPHLRHLKVYWSLCVLMILAAPVFATTIVMPTDEQLIAKSPVIVEGTVVSSTPVARGNAIWTETTLSVAKTIKGNAAGTITIREMGGVLDNRITKIFGAPEYAPGGHVLVFLTPTPRGDYQTTDLYVGKMTEERKLDGRMLWSRHDEASGVVLLDSNFNPLQARNLQR